MRVVIFGAGASAFSCSCKADDRTPLGQELMPNVLGMFPSLGEKLPSDLMEDFATIGRTETALQRVFDEFDNHINTPIYREIARYLSRFYPCSCKRDGYRQLIRAVRNFPSRVVFASLNYDLLLERTLLDEGIPFAYGSRHRHRGAHSVLKPHGSINFLPNIGSNRISGGTYSKCETYVEVEIFPPTLNTDDLLQWLDDPVYEEFAPAISTYTPRKNTMFSSSIVMAHRAELKQLLTQSSRIAVVGVSFNASDVHLWPLLQGQVRIVDPFPSEELELWQRDRSAVRLVKAGFAECADEVGRFLVNL